MYFVIQYQKTVRGSDIALMGLGLARGGLCSTAGSLSEARSTGPRRFGRPAVFASECTYNGCVLARGRCCKLVAVPAMVSLKDEYGRRLATVVFRPTELGEYRG